MWFPASFFRSILSYSLPPIPFSSQAFCCVWIFFLIINASSFNRNWFNKIGKRTDGKCNQMPLVRSMTTTSTGFFLCSTWTFLFASLMSNRSQLNAHLNSIRASIYQLLARFAAILMPFRYEKVAFMKNICLNWYRMRIEKRYFHPLWARSGRSKGSEWWNA